MSTYLIPLDFASGQGEAEGEAGIPSDDLQCEELETAMEELGGEQVPVFDESNLAVNTMTAKYIEGLWKKECIIDKKVRAEAKRLIAEAANAQIEFITTGRIGYSIEDATNCEENSLLDCDPTDRGPGEGLPFYVTDPIKHLQGITQNQIAFELAKYERQTSAHFMDQVKTALENSFSQAGQQTYDLDTFVDDPETFLRTGDPGEGNDFWQAWRALTWNDMNNPAGNYLATQARIRGEVEQARQRELLDLQYGDGFLSQRSTPGNRAEKPGATLRDQIVNIQAIELENLIATSEAGEIDTDKNETSLSQSIADETISIDQYRLREALGGLGGPFGGWGGEFLGRISEWIDGAIPTDINQLIGKLAETFNIDCGGGIQSCGGAVLQEMINHGLSELGILEYFNLNDLLSIVGNPSELLNIFGPDKLIDVFGLGRILDHFNLGQLLSGNFDLADLINSAMNAADVRALLNELGINPQDFLNLDELLDEMGLDRRDVGPNPQNWLDEMMGGGIGMPTGGGNEGEGVPPSPSCPKDDEGCEVPGGQCEIEWGTIADNLRNNRLTNITEDSFHDWAKSDPSDPSGDVDDIIQLMGEIQCAFVDEITFFDALGGLYDFDDDVLERNEYQKQNLPAIAAFRFFEETSGPILSPSRATGNHAVVLLDHTKTAIGYDIEVFDSNIPTQVITASCEPGEYQFSPGVRSNRVGWDGRKDILRCIYDDVLPRAPFMFLVNEDATQTNNAIRSAYNAACGTNPNTPQCNRDVSTTLKNDLPNIRNQGVTGSPQGICFGWSTVVLKTAYFGNFIGECS